MSRRGNFLAFYVLLILCMALTPYVVAKPNQLCQLHLYIYLPDGSPLNSTVYLNVTGVTLLNITATNMSQTGGIFSQVYTINKSYVNITLPRGDYNFTFYNVYDNTTVVLDAVRVFINETLKNETITINSKVLKVYFNGSTPSDSVHPHVTCEFGNVVFTVGDNQLIPVQSACNVTYDVKLDNASERLEGICGEEGSTVKCDVTVLAKVKVRVTPPIPGVNLTLMVEGGPATYANLTNSEGITYLYPRSKVGVVAGTYRVKYCYKGRCDYSSIDITSREPVKLKIKKVRITILSADGEELRNVDIYANGRAVSRIDFLWPGRYEITITPGNRLIKCREIDVLRGDEFTVRCPIYRRLCLKVTMRGSGLNGVHVVMRSKDFLKEGFTDSRGMFCVDYLPFASYDVTVGDRVFRVDINEGGIREIRIELANTAVGFEEVRVGGTALKLVFITVVEIVLIALILLARREY